MDKATHPDYKQRIKDCSYLAIEFSKVVEAMHKDFRYLDFSVAQQCSFCGAGNYEIIVDALDAMSNSVMGIRNFGFTPVGSAQWLIMVCNN